MKDRSAGVLALALLGLAVTASQTIAQSSYTFTTLAGNAGYGIADGTGSAARFSGPSGVAVDSAGDVYVADYYNDIIPRTIKKVFTVLEPALMLLLIFVVGCVALAIYLPIIALMGSIKG